MMIANVNGIQSLHNSSSTQVTKIGNNKEFNEDLSKVIGPSLDAEGPE